MGDLFPALGVVVAALGGAAIGVERQWSGHATGTHPHLGGVRTFTLIGGAAGLAGALATAGYGAVAATVVAGLVAVIVLGYLAASRNHIDATTEVAAVVVVAARHEGVRLVHHCHACGHGHRNGSGAGDCAVKLKLAAEPAELAAAISRRGTA